MFKMSFQKFWHKLFEIGIILKGINGLWESVSGFLFLFLNKATLNSWFYWVIRGELLEDPNDRFINFLTHHLQNFSNDAKMFAAAYLLGHGFLNIFLAIQLYRDKHWAYLVTIGTLISFIFYQTHRVFYHHSWLLAGVTIFDILLIFVIWHEYKFHRDKKRD